MKNMKFLLPPRTEHGRSFFGSNFNRPSMASTSASSARNQSNGETSATLVCPASRCPLPTWNRTFLNAEALLDHARQTRNLHPLCTTCLRVFKDTAALDQVRDLFLCSYPPQPSSFRILFYIVVARRGEACRRMSALQSKIQVAIRPRSTLARFVCSSKLPSLRCRSCRHERPRCGEGRPAPVCHLMDLLMIKPPSPACSTLPIPILKCAVAVRSWTRAT
jgi:hypothetical protein